MSLSLLDSLKKGVINVSYCGTKIASFCVTVVGSCFFTEIFVYIGGDTFVDCHIFCRKIVVIFRVIEEKLQCALKQMNPQFGLHAITDQIKCIRLAGDTLWDRVLVLQL